MFSGNIPLLPNHVRADDDVQPGAAVHGHHQPGLQTVRQKAKRGDQLPKGKADLVVEREQLLHLAGWSLLV